MCCGQKRQELVKNQSGSMTRNGSSTGPTTGMQHPRTHIGGARPNAPFNVSTGAQAATAVAGLQATVILRYLANSPIRVRGLVTGHNYEFSAARRVQAVDGRDVPSLLSLQRFQRA